MEDNVESESENYRNTETYGYKDIVLRQVQKVVTNLSREQKEGFWIYSNNPNIASQKIKYIGDARKESIQSIETLYDLLLPRFDNTIREETKDFETKLEEALAPIKKQYDESRDEGERRWYVDESWKVKRQHYRKMFQQLCNFLQRIGWFEVSSLEDSD